MNVKKIIQDRLKKENAVDKKQNNILSNVNYDARVDNFIDNLNNLFIDGVLNQDVNVNGNILCRSVKTSQIIVRGDLNIKDDAVKIIKKSKNILNVSIATKFTTSDFNKNKILNNRIVGTIPVEYIGKIDAKKIDGKLNKDRLSRLTEDKFSNDIIAKKYINYNFKWSDLNNIIPDIRFDKNTNVNKITYPILSSNDILGKHNINNHFTNIGNNMLSNKYHYYNDISIGVYYDNGLHKGNILSNNIDYFDICFNKLVYDVGWNQNNEMSPNDLVELFKDTSFGDFLKGNINLFSNNGFFSDIKLKNILNNDVDKLCFDIIDKVNLYEYKLKFNNSNNQIGVIADEIKDYYNLTDNRSYSIKTSIKIKIKNNLINLNNIDIDILNLKENIHIINVRPINNIIVFDNIYGNSDNVFYKLVNKKHNYTITNNYNFIISLKHYKDNLFEIIDINNKQVFSINQNYDLNKMSLENNFYYEITEIILKDIKHIKLNNLFFASYGAFNYSNKIIENDISNNNKIINDMIKEIEDQEQQINYLENEVKQLENYI